MKKDEQYDKPEPRNQMNARKRSYKRICKSAAVVLFSDLLIAAVAFTLLKEEPLYYPQSEAVIRSKIYNKEFAEVEQLSISGVSLIDIKPLRKFTNLKRLFITYAHSPQKEIPAWKKVLAKLHIQNFSNQNALDLSPLKKLDKLEKIRLHSTPVKNIRPLSGLSNLQELDLGYTTVRDLRPLRNLKELQQLDLMGTPVSNLEPLKGLTNLKYLNIISCDNITDKQIADLKKNLPDLSITTIAP